MWRPPYFKHIRVMLELGNTSEFISKGLITLKPKSGDHSRLGNWRPITLFGSMYKFFNQSRFSKTLALSPRNY
jgi:hypothetical protein